MAKGAGRGFCAGGDVATVYHLGKSGIWASICTILWNGWRLGWMDRVHVLPVIFPHLQKCVHISNKPDCWQYASSLASGELLMDTPSDNLRCSIVQTCKCWQASFGFVKLLTVSMQTCPTFRKLKSVIRCHTYMSRKNHRWYLLWILWKVLFLWRSIISFYFSVWYCSNFCVEILSHIVWPFMQFVHLWFCSTCGKYKLLNFQ